jgi:hypothetical protein
MATKLVEMLITKKSFMDMPPEMRNQIYETLNSENWDSPIITTDKLNCNSIVDLIISLDLHERFPLLATSKQIMHEVLQYYLEKCTLRLENTDQEEAICAARYTPAFQHLSANIHSVHLDLSWYGHGIDNPRDCRHPGEFEQVHALIPLPRREHPSSYFGRDSMGPRAFTAFPVLINELVTLFPNITSLTIDLDKTTLPMHNMLKRAILSKRWPSLRSVKFRRPDLERQFAKATEEVEFWSRRGRHQAAVWPPRAIPWQLEMDCRFLASVNETMEVDMLRKVREGGEAVPGLLCSGPL